MCSRINLKLSNSARRLTLSQGATAFELDVLPLVLAYGCNNWSSFPLLSLPVVSLSFSYYMLDDSVDGDVHCLVYTVCFWDLPVETGHEPQSNVFVAVHPSKSRGDLSPRLCADAWRPLPLSLSSSLSSSLNARATYLVRRDSSQFTSICSGLLCGS